MSDTFPTPEGAAGAVLDRLAARDRGTLLSLAVDEDEFRELVWPELPSARPEVNLPVEYAWGRLSQNSRLHLARTLAAHGGRRYTLVAVRFGDQPQQYASFTVHPEAELDVRDVTGAVMTLRLFGSLLERDGHWKVFSYVVD
jgi:hypothetical protein